MRATRQTQGHMLAASSNCDTVSRNCGIFWSIFQVSSLTRVTSVKLHNHDVESFCSIFQVAHALSVLLVWGLWAGEEGSGTASFNFLLLNKLQDALVLDFYGTHTDRRG